MASTDPDLLAAARQHDPDAWDILLQRHQLPLHAYAAELLRDDTAAFDIVQETFAAAVRHIAGLRDDRRFAAWLFGIAHQKCLQHFRRVRRDGEIFAPAPADNALVDWPDPAAPDPRTLLLRRETADEWLTLLASLPAAQRSALLLHVLEDFSLDEIATITAVPLGTVKSRLHHAKRALRQLVEAAR